MNADVIVIGSGVSGLSSAIVLAKAGRKVLVLEQHTIPGGLMQNYSRGGAKFPTGVHLLGSLAPQQVTWAYLKYLGVMDRIRPTRMKNQCFLRLHYTDHIFEIPQGHLALKEKLHCEFPSERIGIERYFYEMIRCAANVPYHTPNPDNTQIPARYLQTSLEVFLDENFASSRLKKILKSFVIFYGTPASECPLFVHFLVLDNYLKSAWQLDENDNPLAKAFVHALEADGGIVCIGKKVTSLELDGERLCGVRCQTGEVFSAPLVIFSGHPANLFELTAIKPFAQRVHRKIESVSNTPGFFGVNMTLDGSSCPLTGEATAVFTGADPDTLFQGNVPPTKSKECVLFTSANPVASHGRFSITNLFTSPQASGQQWEASTLRNRPKEYRVFKRKIENYATNQLEEMWPQYKGQFKVASSFSPLTVRDYTGVPYGTPYGLKKTTDSNTLLKLAMPTNINGLYLTGHNLFVPGVLGAITSAIHTCSRILGHATLMNEIVDIMKSNNHSH